MNRLGAEHVRTGSPIVYTSADSVFQILAHERVVPVEELYGLCRIGYELVVEGLGVGRVIARPFIGEPGHFVRTANRHDFASPPFGETLLDRLTAGGVPVVAIGKIKDLFAGRGITRSTSTASDDEGVDAIEEALEAEERSLIFANLVDFDTQYGHRNDIEGYARNLERFDSRLAELVPRLRRTDLLVITADHGNDPTTRAPIIRGSTCRSSRSARAPGRPWTSASAPPLPTSRKRSRIFLASASSRAARAFAGRCLDSEV